MAEIELELRVHMGKKRVKRTANRLFLGSEHQTFQQIVCKTNLKIYIYFYLYFYHFSLIKSEQRGQKMGKK